MLNRSLTTFTFLVTFVIALTASSFAQSPPPAATTPQTPPGVRRPATKDTQTSTETQPQTQQDPAQQSGSPQSDSQPSAPATPPSGSRARRAETKSAPEGTPRASSTGATASDPTSRGVRSAFNALIDGIERADVDAVMGVYWNSPQLVLFNNNGTVTKTWDQVRGNRASSYPDIKDVRLEVRDVNAQMLGRDGAFVTCSWTQSQTFRTKPESATGRLTVVFRRIGGAWKAVHAHTSPEAPAASRVLPSERTQSPTPTKRTEPTSTPKAPTTP
ncbi:MAG: DUF3225 domain-containing protein [Pyrinomonadaceae bacterium]|nr:DUF3225 domain-containing protein [Pyrinomonadaceae bacterium]